MKYFVTGATGFIGKRVAQQLTAAGHEVIALVRTPAKATNLAQHGVTLAQGDITDKESMRAPMTGVDGVFHIAGWYEVGTKDKTPGERINIQGTRNVLEMMRELNIPKGVYTSTLAVNSDTHGQVVDENYHFTGQHISEYDRTKAVAHQDVAEPMIKAGLPLAIASPGLVYGSGDHSNVRTTLQGYLQRRLPMIPQKTGYCWAHVDDIAAGHVQAMEKGIIGETYFICGPTYTLVEALQMAQRITGIPVPMAVPPALFSISAAMTGIVERFVTLPPLYTAEGLRVAAGVTYFGSNAKAKRELGFDPRPLEVGLRELLRYEMTELGMKPNF
ncbi:MAG: NAD-dependent epimerase/dehydratase family protein [Anaerolineae bacterium]|nr:NAD-dependent epimerase/dehydratase family protein [Anaerolineae bacterium]